jgi:DNA primase
MAITVEKLKTLIDYDLLLTSLGFKVYYSNQDEIRAACAIHGGDNKTAFCLKKSSGRFYCFTKKCEMDSSGEINNDVISLVMRVNNCSFIDSVKYIANLMNVVVDFSHTENVEDYKTVNITKDREKFIKGVFNKNSSLPEIDNSILTSSITGGADYFRSIGISEDIIKNFELGSMIDDHGVNRGTIPIRDDLGRFVGLSGRRVDGNEEPRYRLIKDFKKSKVLYNLYNAKKVKDAYRGKIIVVEGFKAAWYVYGCGFTNVCAVMGAKISQDQINLLVRYNISDCVLMLDGDEAGRIGMDRSLSIMVSKINTIPVYLPDNLSPDDVNKEELKDLLSTFTFF